MGLDMYLIKRKKDIKSNDFWNFNHELIYWRKANQIHKYFCDNGEEIEEEVVYKLSKEILEDLLNKCDYILEIVKTKKGEIQNGMRWENGKWEPILQEGIEIINQDEIEEVLPTQEGFFFGSTNYDEFYLNDIKYTKDRLEEVLKEVNFENDDVYYLASW